MDLSNTYGHVAKRALVIGASGLVGRNLTDLLLTSPYYQEVYVLVRTTLPLQHPKLTQLTYDFDQATNSLPAVDDIFCTIGTTIKKAGSKEAFRKVDYLYPLQIAQQSLQQGAKQFLLVSSIGASTQSSFFYSRVKGEIEHALTALPFNAVHIFRPSILTGARSEVRVGEEIGKLVTAFINPLLVGPLRKYRSIQGSEVAKAMLQVAVSKRSGTHIYESNEIKELANDF